MAKELVGKIVKFFPKISVAVVKVEKKMTVGDQLSIEGHGKEFQQELASMQVEHKTLESAKKGDDVGMKTNEPVKEGDLIYRITE